MTIEWTRAQQDAIRLQGPDLLVSAGAGAGKTSVLVERVIRLITDPQRRIEVDRLLVVTFSEEAAAEMRRRIRRQLEDAVGAAPASAWLRRQLGLLGRAQISTLHAFCLQLVRRYFHQLDLDPGVRVMGEHEASLLEQDVLEDLFEAAYAAGDEAFLRLVESYGGRGDEQLQQLVLRIHRLAYSQPFPAAWLQRAVAPFARAQGRPLEATDWYPVVHQQLVRGVHQAVYAVAAARRLAGGPGGPEAWRPVLAQDVARLQEAQQALQAADWDESAAVLAEVAASWPRLPAARDVEPARRSLVQKQRNRAKGLLRGLSREVANRSSARLCEELAAWQPLASRLVALARDFAQAFGAAKRQRRVLDFADMERCAFDLLQDETAPAGQLQPAAVARQLHEAYDEVLVDEYQDINELQDAIIHLIAHAGGTYGSLFLVGDVKQSIYRFRLAEPELFVAKYRSFTPVRDDAGDVRQVAQARVDLNQNFRSRPSILAAVNFTFRQLMRPELGGIAYDDAAALTAGFSYPEPAAACGQRAGEAPVELHLMERDLTAEPAAVEPQQRPPMRLAEPPAADRPAGGVPLDTTTAVEREAGLMARRIQGMVGGDGDAAQLAVWDREQAAYRPVRFGDIVILLRAARGHADVLQDVLGRMGIPVYARAAKGFFQALEVEIMLALLRLIDNPRQEIAMATVLRSPLAGLSPESLTSIRLAAPQGHFCDAVQEAAASGGRGEHRLHPDPLQALRTFLARLERWRTQARRAPLGQLLTRVYDETGFVTYVSGMPGGEQRRANLLGLLERARQFDRFQRQGLFRFLRFIERLQERDDDLAAAPALAEGDDVVRIMTVHQSKGLEFPVVFLANLGGQFTLDSGDLLLDRRLGFGPRFVDLEQRIRYPTLAYHAVREETRVQGLAEELRLLYVAMTRARERLVLVGSVRGLAGAAGGWLQAAAADEWLLPAPLAMEARTFLDWLGPVVARHEDGRRLRELAGEPALQGQNLLRHRSKWRVQVWLPDQLPAVAPGTISGSDGGLWQRLAAAEPLPDRDPQDMEPLLAASLQWRYPHREQARRFAKLAATEVKSTVDPQRQGHPSPGRLRQVLAAAPRFVREQRTGGGEPTPVARGIAVHRVLQLLNLSRPLHGAGIAAQLDELVAEDRLRPEMAEQVSPEQLAAFFASPLGARVLADPQQVQREVMFTMQAPVTQVYPELAAGDDGPDAGEGVVVQGMIDCLVREAEGYLLIDFKTDRLPRELPLEVHARRYTTQLDLYRQAVAASTGRPVHAAYLYFLSVGRAVALASGPGR